MQKSRFYFLLIILLFSIQSFAQLGRPEGAKGDTGSKIQRRITVSFVIGRAQFQKKGAKTWDKLSRGMTLDESDKVRTKRGATVVLKLGTLTLKVAPRTELELTSLSIDMKIYLNNGKLWSKMARIKRKRRLYITTPMSVAGVRGTEFIMEALGAQDKLYVLDGVVGYGKDIENLTQNVTKGKVAIFKDGKISIRPMTAGELMKIRNAFPDISGGKGGKKTKMGLTRSVFKDQIHRSTIEIKQTRDYTQKKIPDDLSTNRVVKDRNGEVTQILQIMKKTDNNTVRLFNITKKDNFINVLQYTGTFENPIPNTLDQLKAMQDNELINKEMYIVQSDQGIVDEIWIQEDLVADTARLRVIVNNGTTDTGWIEGVDSSKLEQVGDHKEAYYYEDGHADDSNYVYLIVKLYIVSEDGSVVSDPDTDVPLDILATGSMEFEYSVGTNLNSHGVTTFGSPQGTVRFSALSDLAFISWLQ